MVRLIFPGNPGVFSYAAGASLTRLRKLVDTSQIIGFWCIKGPPKRTNEEGPPTPPCGSPNLMRTPDGLWRSYNWTVSGGRTPGRSLEVISDGLSLDVTSLGSHWKIHLWAASGGHTSVPKGGGAWMDSL